MMKKIFSTVIMGSLALFLTACTKGTNELVESGSLEPQGEIQHDFGEISINGGVVTHVFGFANKSDQPLNIYEVTTSCGCTNAEILVGGKGVGTFGMHDSNEDTIVVPPNYDFTVVAKYDPLFHGPNDLGPRNRTIFLFTSSALREGIVRPYRNKPNFTEIKVQANVVPTSS